jgi:regulator of Ty1 transposition protein 103
VQIWLQRLKDSPSPKRLNLIYLANEVTQQSKARKKEDFVVAFAPIIAEATSTAYKGAPSELQGKLRRVIDVWKDRSIFEAPIQAAIESRIEGEPRHVLEVVFPTDKFAELDKSRGVKTTGFGGSIFATSASASTSSPSPSLPSELGALVAPQQNVTKLTAPAKLALISASADYDKLTDPKNETPSAPVHAARLNGLLKTLANAEFAVANCVKARQELVGALEKILQANKASLEAEKKDLEKIQSRKETIDGQKQEVELAIMRGMAANDQERSPGGAGSASPPQELDRPEIEALTPPHESNGPEVEALTPPPQQDPAPASYAAQTEGLEMPGLSHAQPGQQQTLPRSLPPAPGIEMLSNLASQYQSVPVAVNGSQGIKRRRLDSNEDFPDLGGEGIDEDVTEMLRKDSAA